MEGEGEGEGEESKIQWTETRIIFILGRQSGSQQISLHWLKQEIAEWWHYKEIWKTTKINSNKHEK